MDLEQFLVPLRLNQLRNDWVQDIWDREFMDHFPLPSDYNLDDRRSCILINIIKHLQTSLFNGPGDASDDDDSTAGESWKSLVNVIKHDKLISLLFSLINIGEEEIQSDEHRLCAIYAARLYFVMLTIPGSSAYKVFHCQMFIVCLKVFKFGEKLLEHEEVYNDHRICSNINAVNRQLVVALNDLNVLIGRFNLKTNNVCLEETVSSLVDLTNSIALNSRLNIDKNTLGKISGLSFNCLNKLIDGSSSTPDKSVINMIFKCLVSKFVITEKTIKKNMVSLQMAGLTHCAILLTKYGESAVDGCTCLIQHLCCDSSGMMRAENRSFRVKTVIGLMALLPHQPYIDQLQWIVKLSRNSISAWRCLALDVIGFIIAGNDRNISDVNENSDERCIMANERSLDGEDDDISHVPSSEISDKHGNVGHKDLLNVVVERCQDVTCSVRTNALTILVSCTSQQNDTLNALIKEMFGNGDVLLMIAEHKLNDERVLVRRIAIKLLDSLLKTRGELLIQKNLQLIVNRCRDTSILVRSLSINTLTGLALVWGSANVAEAWLDGVMNQLSDPESKIQDLVLDSLVSLLFKDLVTYNSGSCTVRERFPWIFLSALIRKNMRRHLGRACLMLSKHSAKVLTLRLVETLSSHIRTENNLSCWVFLSCIARYIPITDVSFVIDYFNESTTDSLFDDIQLLVLVQEVLCEWCTCLDDDQSIGLRNQLIRSLHYNAVPSGATRGTVALAIRLSRDSDYSWAASLMEEYENRILMRTNPVDMQDDIGGGVIIAMADLALAAEKKPSLDIISILLKMVDSFEVDGDANNCPISVGTRAAAIASLGKLSLREKSTAVRTTKLCARLLASSMSPLPLKINAMCVLADMSIRYTAIVEPMLPGMYVCLASKDLTIRRMAVQLITQLLVSDFLKLRDALYFNYFSLLCDSDEKIKDTATYYVFQCLIQKDKNILYKNFVNSVFYYNNYRNSLAYKDYEISDEERALFSLKGDDKRADRYMIYDMMLSHMTDVQRLNTQIRLCNQAISVGEEGISGTDVLRDSLDILRKLSRYPQSKEQNDDLATRVTSNIAVQVEEVLETDTDFLNEIRKFQKDSDTNFPNVPSTIRRERRPSKFVKSSTKNKEDVPSSSKNVIPTTPKRRASKVKRVILNEDFDLENF
ncbi:chromosome associated protein D3 isoform X2 [Arctopsyche grandis]|uniref:chromosome associated protein D3 isoform X2 n=1 Tax=Arctopsyche grandis TaxID=121162 RepID=UPI00406D7BD5